MELEGAMLMVGRVLFFPMRPQFKGTVTLVVQIKAHSPTHPLDLKEKKSLIYLLKIKIRKTKGEF